jgi:glycosyltransferase involved in cell wall biosynthesis
MWRSDAVRIAYFSEVFLPKVDGVVNTLCHLFEYLGDQGYESILFAPNGGPDLYDCTPVLGHHGYAFPRYPELRLVPPTIDVTHTMKNFQPDLIHVVNPASLGWVGIRYGYKNDIPIVASYHTDLPGFAKQWGLGFLNPLVWRYFRLIHNQADLTLAPSEFTAQEIRAKGFLNVKVWSRGVDTQGFSPSKRSQAWRVRFTDGYPGTPILLYVGRLAKEKRVHLLHDVIKDIPEACLVIVGDGPERPELERLFADTNTIFTGYLTGEELAEAYASSDVFVFPGANETFGNVILEAMASGLPVVAPKSGGVVDFVIDRVTGYLFAPDDTVSLLLTTKLLVQYTTVARRMGAAGRIFAEARSWEIVMDELIEHYHRLCKEHSQTQVFWQNSNLAGKMIKNLK